MRLSYAWPLPEEYRELHPDADQERLPRGLAETANRERLAKAVLDGLAAERTRLPAAVVETLRTWVRGFGCAADAA